MAKKVYEEQNISNIAIAIREKTGGNKTYKTSEMAEAIHEVYTEGYAVGFGGGHTEGYEMGYSEGYETGKAEGGNTEEAFQQGYDIGHEEGQQAEYDRFWDSFQRNGELRVYSYAFAGAGWNDETFKPKYPFNNMTYAEGIFTNAGITNLDVDIDTSNLVAAAGSMFAKSEIKTIKSFKFSSKYSLPYAFQYANKLENITIAGEIPLSTRFEYSPLTHDSLMSIINALKSGVTETLRLGTDNLAKLTDTEKAIATEKGWTLA